jgi:hypothetical protein
MTNRINELYIEFHTSRRLRIETEVEKRFQQRIKDGWLNSPSTRKEVFYQVLEDQPSEGEDFKEFAKLVIQECIDLAFNAGDNVVYLHKLHEDRKHD